MFESRPGSALEKINSRKKFVLELIFLAIFFAILINIFSSCLQNLIFNPDQDFKKSVWGVSISGFLIFSATLLTILGVLLKKETEAGDLAVTIPVSTDHKNKISTIALPKTYEFAGDAKLLFDKAKKQIAEPFYKNWLEIRPSLVKSLKPGCYGYDAIMELMEAVTIILIKNFGERSLTHNAMHHGEFRNLAGKINPLKLSIEKWPSKLRENPFLKARGIQNILIPAGARLEHFLERKEDSRKPNAHIIKISAEYITFSFAITPYWTTLRDIEPCKSEFLVGSHDNIDFLRIPVDISMELRGGFLSFKGIYFDNREMSFQYSWAKKLMENAYRRLDWGYHIREKQ